MTDSRVLTEQQQELLDAALFYVSKGWKVLPLHSPVTDDDGLVSCSCNKPDCKSGAKHPRLMHGLRDASSDPEQIKRWWDMWPDANIGICTGSTSGGLVVIDIDKKHDGVENWKDLIASKPVGVPETPIALTGGGGFHLLFTCPDKIPNSASKITRGVDVRGEGGYIVAPPSLHMSGKRYEWEISADPHDVPMSEMTGWLLEAAASDPAPIARPNMPTASTLTGGVIQEGARNETLFKLGRSLRARGCDEETILAMLRTYNTTKCIPPLDDSEVGVIAKQAAKKGAGTSNANAQKASVDKTALVMGDNLPPLAAEPLKFVRGDSAEIATRLIVDARGESPVPVLYDRGEFWRYESSIGLWSPISRMALTRHCLRYAGTIINDKPLKLSEGLANGAINFAASLCEQPGFFDNAPPGMAFRNGFVMIDEHHQIQLLQHSPNHRARAGMNSDWNTSLKAPMFRKFIIEIFTLPGDVESKMSKEDQEELEVQRTGIIVLVAEFIGACLVGDATKYEAALVLYGDTAANGKSTLIKIVKALFPSKTVASLSPSEWGNRFYLAELALARLNAVSEMPASEITANDLFKSVISGDEVAVARKFKDPFTMRPLAGHIFACNELPATIDHTEGFWRRFIPIPFNRFFAPEERDTELAKKIIAAELGAIAVHAILAAADLRKRGNYDIPYSVQVTKDLWKGETDVVMQWVKARTRKCDGNCSAMCRTKYSPNCHVTGDVAYPSFAKWCKQVGIVPMKQQTFLTRLNKIVRRRNDGVRRFYPIYLPELITSYAPVSP